MSYHIPILTNEIIDNLDINPSGIYMDCTMGLGGHSKIILQNDTQNNSYNNYNKIRFVVERFFAWLKNGFHRTRIRYEKNCDNYLEFVYLASIMMY